MKFWTLLKKELRESCGAMMIAGFIFIVLTGFNLYYFVDHGANDYEDYDRQAMSGHIDRLFHPYPLDELAPILIFSSFGLGIGLAIHHFWTPKQTRTWGFLIHRSVSRDVLLASKLTAGLLVFVIAIGLPWTLFFRYVNHVKMTAFEGVLGPRLWVYYRGLGPGLWRQFMFFVFRGWGGSWECLLISMLWVGLTFFHGRCRWTSRGKVIVWLIFVLLFNLVGFLTYLALNHTPLIRCPACGKKRGLRQDACPRCQAPLPQPECTRPHLVMA